MKQAEGDRERWESEKDGWARMAEALLGRRSRQTSSASKDTVWSLMCYTCKSSQVSFQDPDRQYYYASDNRVLREKVGGLMVLSLLLQVNFGQLHDTQARLQALESELVKLRPILLMQPSISQSQSSLGYTSSFLSSIPFPSLHAAKSKLKKKQEVKTSRHFVPNPDEQEASDSQPQIQTDSQPTEGLESSSFLQFQAQPVGTGNYSTSFTGDHYRKSNTTLVSGPLTAPPTTTQFQVSASSTSTSQMPSSNKPSPHLQPPTQPAHPGPSSLVRKVRTKSKHPQGGSVPVIPLTSDARSEHLLLAARKIGRERAGVVAGYIRNMRREIDEEKKEQDRERERIARETERLDRERQERLADRGAGGLSYYRTESMDAATASPKTPKRRTGNDGHYLNSSGGSGGIDVTAIQSPQPLNPALGFVDPRKTAGHSVTASRVQPTTIDASLDTPRQGGSGSGSQSLPGKSTPLASLIDAARRMNNGRKGDSEHVNGGGRRRSVEAIEEPESPLPKRRKVGRRGSTGADRGDEAGEEGPGVARMKSALDVLADQAAAAVSSTGNGKGKGKEKEITVDEGAEADTSVAPKAKRKVKATEKAREKAKLTPVRKPRARAPPKERRLAPAPSANIDPTSSAGKAAPRMISPPRPRPFSAFGGSSERLSPVDTLPPTKVPPPPKDVQSSDVQPRPIGEVVTAPVRPNSSFGFVPVTRWNGSGSDEEERGSSSSLRGGDKSASGLEERQQEKVSEASCPEEEMEENLLHNNPEKEWEAEIVVDADRGSEDPSPESGTGEDAMVTTIVEAVRVDPDEFDVERRLRDEEPGVDRQNISMGLDEPSDVEQLLRLDGTDIDMQGPVDRSRSMENDEPNPENEAGAEPSTGAVGGQDSENDQRPSPGPSHPRNSATSPPSVPDPPCQYPDTSNPHEDTDADADADADADEDVDAEGEADADGDVDPDAEGDVDLGAESTFSGLVSDTSFMDMGATQPAEYALSSPTLSSSLLDTQDKAQPDYANGISGTEAVPSNPIFADKRLPGDRHS